MNVFLCHVVFCIVRDVKHILEMGNVIFKASISGYHGLRSDSTTPYRTIHPTTQQVTAYRLSNNLHFMKSISRT